MKVKTVKLGGIELVEDNRINFSTGIIGFENTHCFAVVAHDDYSPFRWLVSLEDDQLGLPILNPFLIMPEFGKELPEKLVNRILSSEERVDIFCVVTVDNHHRIWTVNLKGPIIIDYRAGVGEQIILWSDDLPVDQPMFATANQN